MWIMVLYATVLSLALYALVGWALWFTGNLLVLAALVLSPFLWMRISFKSGSKNAAIGEKEEQNDKP